jgi:hypothetical protein
VVRNLAGPLRSLPIAVPNAGPAAVPLVDAGGQAHPLAGVASSLLLFQLFLLYSRGPELLSIYVSGYLYLVRPLAIALLIALVFTGGLRRVFASRAVLALTAFTAWLLLATPFSVWPGGSVAMLREYWSRTYLLAITTAGLIVSTNQVRKALQATGLGTALLALLTSFVGDLSTGRLQLEAGTLSNPNDLAFFLLGGIPGCVLLSKSPGIGWRMAGRLGIVLILLSAFNTGSRMGILMVLALVLVQFFRLPNAAKAKLLLAAVVIGAAGAALMPPEALDRYRTMWSDPATVEEEPDSRQAQYARGSTDGRTALFKLSLKMTFANPLLGVGPGMFGEATSADDVAREQKLAWRQTHNSYTQISSEAGIPALILYLVALVHTIRITVLIARRLRSVPSLKPLADTADALFLALLLFAVGACFGSFAYGFYFPVLAALAAALEGTARAELAAMAARARLLNGALPPSARHQP